MRRARQVQDAEARAEAEETARQLVPAVIRVVARAGEEGKLFGSVTSADVVAAAAVQTGIEIDRKALLLGEPLKSLGSHQIPVRLHPEVEFPLTVEVTEA
jgi:large subunit ribosomal protein L9